MRSVNDLRVVCIGGGLGAPTIMRGLRRYTDAITGLIAVTDSGRSTGKVRIALDVPAPGDIRNALVVLADGDPLLRRLFQHRFRTDKSEDLDGMAFGNLFLAGLTQLEGSFPSAVAEAARILGVRGTVLPVTFYNTHLAAELTDGTIVEEELNVRAPGKAPIARLYLKDTVEPSPGTVEAIEAAELITIGPGSLYTTVCANLLVPDIARAIADSDALVVYITNTTRQPGQTDDMSLSEHVRAVLEYLGGRGLDVALVNDGRPSADLLAHYGAQGLELLEPTEREIEAIRALGVTPVLMPVVDTWSGPRELWQKQDTIRHDPDRVADALMALLREQRPRPVGVAS